MSLSRGEQWTTLSRGIVMECYQRLARGLHNSPGAFLRAWHIQFQHIQFLKLLSTDCTSAAFPVRFLLPDPASGVLNISPCHLTFRGLSSCVAFPEPLGNLGWTSLMAWFIEAVQDFFVTVPMVQSLAMPKKVLR